MEAANLARQDYQFASLSDSTVNHLSTLGFRLSDAAVAATEEGKLDAALKYQLAALQLWQRLDNSLPTNYSPSIWTLLKQQRRLVDWANAEGQSAMRVKRAIAALDSVYPPVRSSFAIEHAIVEGLWSISAWRPPAALMADYLAIRRVLLGKELPHSLTQNSEIAAYLANMLPFEHRRALEVLDYLLCDQTVQWYNVASLIDQQRLQGWAEGKGDESDDEGHLNHIGSSLRSAISRAYSLSDIYGQPTVLNSDTPPYCWLRTTFLLRKEYEWHTRFGPWLEDFVARQIAGWGLRQQLALIAYRLDHGQYPDSLDALVPDYLPFVPIDPYSGRPFEYRPHGLEHALGRDYGRDCMVPTHTPLLWSVGPRQAQLRLTTITEPDVHDPTVKLTCEAYYFKLDLFPSFYRDVAPLVFPLPAN